MNNPFYLVASPIGNLEDITLRAIRVITESDVIFAENVNNTKKLIEYINSTSSSAVSAKIYKLNMHNEKKQINSITTLLRDDKKLCYVSDAGMPSISDPGQNLVRHFIDNDVAFEVLPGASAVTTMATSSGAIFSNILFMGFLPKKDAQLEKLAEKIITHSKLFPKTVYIGFESPLRVNSSLQILRKNLEKYRIVYGRELTKLYSEVNILEDSEITEKGEFSFAIYIPR